MVLVALFDVVGIPLKDLKQNLCLENGNHKAFILNNGLTVVFEGSSVTLF